MKHVISVLALAVGLVASVAAGQERVVLFRSMEDAAHPPDPAVCERAPFAVNAQLGASLWSVRTDRRDGEVEDDAAREIGTATACVQLTDFLFPAGLDQNFYVEFDLRDGKLVALGSCKLVSNDVPEAGLVLAGCSLKVISGPPGTIGGVVTSASVFNPFGLEGYNTGSYWTAYLYTDGQGHGRSHHHPGHWHFVQDPRSEGQIREAGAAAR